MKLNRFSKKIVALIIAANSLFTAVILYIFLRTGSEPSTLIISWFAFTTGELGALAGLRHSENKNYPRDAE
jgi:hypothetical protein